MMSKKEVEVLDLSSQVNLSDKGFQDMDGFLIPLLGSSYVAVFVLNFPRKTSVLKGQITR